MRWCLGAVAATEIERYPILTTGLEKNKIKPLELLAFF